MATTKLQYSDGRPEYSLDGKPSEVGVWYTFDGITIKLPDVFTKQVLSTGEGMLELKSALDRIYLKK